MKLGKEIIKMTLSETYNKPINELAVMDNFDLQVIGENLAEAVMEEMDGLGTLPFDRVKIPSGGGLAFEMPGEDENSPASVTEITGVILDHYPVNAYWADKFEGGNQPPDCASYDGKQGLERETGVARECATCPYNQFGSDGRGKACKNIHRIFILREANPVPLMLSLPPTSLKYMRDYIAKRVLFKGLRSWQVVTRITLKKEKSAAGIAYSHAVFTLAGRLNQEQLSKTEAMKDCIRQQYRQLDVEDADYGMAGGMAAVPQDAPARPEADSSGFMEAPDVTGEDGLPFRD